MQLRWLRTLALAWIALHVAMTSEVFAQQKRIYIANDDHTDFMWTADADTYARTFVEMLDFHIRLAEDTDKNPPPYQSRFNADGSYWLWCYERLKSPAEFERLIDHVKKGSISVPLNTVVSCYGGQPTEAVLRGLYYAGRLERKYGMRIEMATAMENQTLPLGLASLFAGSGAKYSWRGVCGCASKIPNSVLGERPREIYWYTGHDGQRLLMKWYSLKNSIGGYWEAGFPEAAIKWVDTDPGFRARYADPRTGKPYDIIGIFGFGGDDLARKTGMAPPPLVPGVPGLQKIVSTAYCDHFHVIAEKESNANRQVIVSNEIDFFRDFEKQYGSTLDAQTVTYGNEWDLYSASLSETSARARRAVESLRSAELLATLVSLKYPDFMKRFETARDRAFADIGLFWEHNWTADGPISRQQRAAWQEQVVTNIEYYVRSVQGEAIVRLGGMIERPADSNRFFVLNPLGHPRTEFADYAYSGPDNVHVIDLTSGEEVAFQLIRLKGVSTLRILATDVPSVGFKVFEIVAGPGKGTSPKDLAATVSGSGDQVIENDHVRLEIQPDGAISSLLDKKHGFEYAAKVGGLYLNDFAPNSDDGEPLKIENAGPVSVTIRARSDRELSHTTAITLYRDSARVDIQNELTENFSNVRHWAFSFNIDDPQVHSEEVGAINLNKLKSDGGDYANTHARYDHITLNHFADISNAAGGVTLSNADLAFARLGNSSLTHLDTQTPQISVLAGGQVDGSWLGIRGQNGQSYFLQRFSLQPHVGYDATSSMRFALEHQNPLLTGTIISKESTQFPGDHFSLLSLSNRDVVLWAMKPHEDGIDKGIVVRVWNQSAESSECGISTPLTIDCVNRVTHIETPLEPVEASERYFQPTIAPHRMESFLIKVNATK